MWPSTVHCNQVGAKPCSRGMPSAAHLPPTPHMATACCVHTPLLIIPGMLHGASQLQQVVDFGLSTWLGFEGREDSSAEVGLHGQAQQQMLLSGSLQPVRSVEGSQPGHSCVLSPLPSAARHMLLPLPSTACRCHCRCWRCRFGVSHRGYLPLVDETRSKVVVTKTHSPAVAVLPLLFPHPLRPPTRAGCRPM